MDPIAMITGIKTAIDLASAIKTISDDVELKSKTSDLYNTIIALQTGIMEMQAQNSSLLQENNSLSKKLMKIETWENEKSKYLLREICTQVFVYESKSTDTNTDPNHWLCAQCYNKGVKSILQLRTKNPSGSYYICHNCNSEICDHSNKEHINFSPGPGNDSFF